MKPGDEKQPNSGHFEENPSPVSPRSFAKVARNAGMRSGDRWRGSRSDKSSGGGQGSEHPDGSASMTGGERYDYSQVRTGIENRAPRTGGRK